MKDIFNRLEAIRGSVAVLQMTGLFLREVAEIIGNVPDLHSGLERDWHEFLQSPSYPRLKAAARELVGLPLTDRLAAITHLFGRAGRGYGPEIIQEIPAKMVAELAGQAASVRCSFGGSAMPALQIALASSQEGRDVHVRFIDLNLDTCDIVKLAAVTIEAEIDVVSGSPLARIDGGSFDAEICIPPFGVDVQDRTELPRKTLERIDATDKGRLHFEPVAMADMLVHAPNTRVVFSFTAGALFRMVGLEAVARSEVVDSGRLASVIAVPPGMIYTTTNIATSIVVLEPAGRDKKEVRFIDLSDSRFGSKTIRGQYDIHRDVSWAEAIDTQLSEDVEWARDVTVEEIHAQSDVLAVERYLQTQSAEALSIFLAEYETKALSDVVEIIRPAALPKSKDGDYTVREVSPGDIGDAGLVGLPLRETQIAYGVFRTKARNQQVRPGDVLLSVKGTIGKVGLVAEDAPDGSDDGFWTAGQSLVILRPGKRIAPEVLYEYLSDDLVQEYIRSFAGGTAIQSISAKDLAALPIPLPDEDQQARVVDQARERHAKFEQIERMRQEIESHRSETWPHRDLGKAVTR